MSSDNTIFDPPSGSLAGSIKRGALLTGGAQGVKLACQFTSVIVLSRLLSPEDFGIVAMAGPILAFVGLFQDLGLTQATIQRKNITHSEVNSLFWVNIGISVLLTAILIFIAPFAARFYNEPVVSTLIIAMSALTIVHAAAGQHGAILNRRMQFGRTSVIGSIAAVAGLVVAIVWALVDPSYWALYAGTLATALSGTIMTWGASEWRPSLPRWVPGTGSLVHFGAGITGSSFANFFARNSDNVLIGRFQGQEELGLYDRAHKLLLFPLQQITYPLGAMMVPALSRMADEPDRYRYAYLRVAPILLLATLPGVAFAIAMADILVPFALGEQWAGSAAIFQALGFTGLLQSLNTPGGWLLVSQGRSMDFLRWSIFTAVVSVTAFVIGLPYGALGVAAAYAASEYLRTPLQWLYIGRKGPIRATDVLRMSFPFLMGAHLAVGLLWAAKPYLPEAPLPSLLLGVLLSYLLVACFAALFEPGRRTLAECLGLLRRKIPVVA